mgnify:CR=1 FL=1
MFSSDYSIQFDLKKLTKTIIVETLCYVFDIYNLGSGIQVIGIVIWLEENITLGNIETFIYLINIT